MKELEKLQKIGAKEITKQTYIALDRIEAILARDFLELRDRAFLLGLLHILEREYKVNFEAFLCEYDEFWEKYDGEVEQAPQVDFKVTYETKANTNSIRGAVFGILGIIVLAACFFSYLSYTGEFELKQTNTQTTKPKPAQTPAEAPAAKQSVQSEPAKAEPEPLKVDETKAELEQAKAEEPKVQTVAIKPRTNVWIGIIYQDNNRRLSVVASNEFSIDLSRPQIIVTGHSLIDLVENGETRELNDVRRAYFEVSSDGAFRQLDANEYAAKTKGSGW